MPRPPRDPFEIRLSPEQRQQLAVELCTEVQQALDARGNQAEACDYWHQLYEQARTRQGRNAPWPDAADLTSYLASEKVDALQARLLRAIWVDPIWTVEGWGASTDKAPFVEEFHQWKAEEERLQSVLDRLSLLSLIEPRGLIEIAEGSERRTVRRTIKAKAETDPRTGMPIYGEDAAPKLALGPDGNPIEAGEMDFALETVIDSDERIRTGPVYRVLPYRDSLITPGHARDREEITGYWKRLWRRYGPLLRKAQSGWYDVEAVQAMSTGSDRESEAALQRAQQVVVPLTDEKADKELWEGVVLLDLNLFFKRFSVAGLNPHQFNAERWFLVTLHVPTQQILRFQHDDMERSRFVPVILFPRPDRATEGFSFIGHKLITTIEEHTAWRNVAADRAAMIAQAPIKRLQNALWDPYAQPWGPRAVIDVRDMREVEAVQVPELVGAVFTHIQMMERTAERIAGVNDISAGQLTSEQRTLGEVRMATMNAEIRMDAIIRRFQEAMEEIGSIRHEIWKRVLSEQPEGVEMPHSVLANLEGRGVSIDRYLPEKKITAQLLEGAFRFKPRGSVETADPGVMRQDLALLLQAIPMFLQAFPGMVPIFQTPAAGRAMARTLLRVFRVDNQQAFLGSPSQDLQQTLLGSMMGGMSGMMPGMSGGPMIPGMMPPLAPGMPMGTPPMPLA